MDWIRRNWPDLLIGLALILVISGIIITLLNGGTFNPFGRSVDTGTGSLSSSSTPQTSQAEEAIPETTAPEAATDQGADANQDVALLPLPTTGDPEDATVNSLDNNSLDNDASASDLDGDAATAQSDIGTSDDALGSSDAASNDTALSDTDALGDSALGDSALGNTDTLSTDVDSADASDSATSVDGATLDGAEAEQSVSVEPVLPDDVVDSSETASETTTFEDAAADSSLTDTESTETAAATDTPITDAATADIAASASADAPYRVAVGTFGVAANAERLASELREASYPVFTAQQDDLTVVLVGPYDERTEADQIASRIRSEGLAPGTEVYEFDPTDSSEASTGTSEDVSTVDTPTDTASDEALATETQLQDTAQNAEQGSDVQIGNVQNSDLQTDLPSSGEVVAAPLEESADTEATDAATSETATTETATAEAGASVQPSASSANVPATSETGTYLQVGAYGSVESSNPQRRTLENLGFTVLHVEEQGLIKLLVGPYEGNDLNAAKSQLGSQGIASFIR